MILWAWLLGVGAILVLAGVWIHERLPHWRAADARARREPLSDIQFGDRFFPPDLAPIAARLRRVVSDTIDRDLARLHPDDAMTHTLPGDFDSLCTVELIMAIEDEFGIDLDDAAVGSLATFRQLVDAVAAQRPFLSQWRRKVACAIETQFGITLPRDVLANVATPLESASAIAAVLKGQVGTESSCQTQRAFHLLRKAMMRVLHVPRTQVRPTTPLSRLIEWRTARSDWTQLRDTLGARQWPTLVRPCWIHWLVHGLPLVLGIGVALGLPALANWPAVETTTVGFIVRFASEMGILVAIAVIAGSWILLMRLSRDCRWAFPRKLQTVADLIPLAMTSEAMPWDPKAIEEGVRDILVNQLQVPPERYHPHARFEQDLGLAAWTATTQTGSTRTEVSTYGHTRW